MVAFAQYPSLAGRVVLVTGGASGIGADIVRAFARSGARVAFLDILAEESAKLVAELADADFTSLFLPCDLVAVDTIGPAVAEVGERLGPIGVLINNAGNDERHAIEDVTPEIWDRTQAINLRPHFFAAQAVHPQMKRLGGGSIVNLSSIVWRIGNEGLVPYAASKAGIVGLTRSLARAFGADDIRVNAIEPGAVMTERQRRLWYTTPEAVEAIVGRQLIRRVLLGEEIARAALFLGADDSRMITKQSIVVDAGLS